MLLILALGGLMAGSSGVGRAWGIHVLSLLIAGLTLVEALLRARGEPAYRFAWRFLAGYAALAFLYRCNLLLGLLLRGTALSHHGPQEAVLWNAAIGLLVATLMTFNQRQGPSGDFLLRILDGMIFSSAFYLVLWAGVVSPAMAASPLPQSFSLLSQGLFALTAAAIGVGLHTALLQGSFRGPVGALVGALTTFLLVFTWSLKASLQGSYPLDHPARIAGVLASLLTLMAVYLPTPHTKSTRLAALADLLPYLPAGAAFLGLLGLAATSSFRMDRLALLLVAVLSILLILRQVITLIVVETLQRTLEQQVEARAQALAAQEALLMRTEGLNLISSLGAGLSHDLNNLLGGASMQAELLWEEGGSENPEASVQIVALQSTLHRAGDLTRRLMAVGRNQDAPILLELSDHLRGLEPLLRAMIPKTIDLDFESSLQPCPIRCVPGHIDQVIVNLLMHARDALAPGGCIHIGLECREEEQQLNLCVTDTGPGHSPEALTHLFDPLIALNASDPGSGLALSSVHTVVGRLGGTISATSQLGKGTQFLVQLPLAYDGGTV